MARSKSISILSRLSAIERRAGGNESLMELERELESEEIMAHIILRIRCKSDDVEALAYMLGWSISRAAESMRRQRRIEALRVYPKKAPDPDDVIDRLIEYMERFLPGMDLNLDEACGSATENEAYT